MPQPTKYIVIDTNVPLTDANAILTLGAEPNTVVVIPETVLAELDAKKGGFDEINWQARATARILSGGKITSIVDLPYGTRTTVKVQSQNIYIVALKSYEANSSEYGGNDQRIIQTAKVLTENLPDDTVVLMTIDYYMRIRAAAVGVKTTDYKIINDADFEFVKDLVITDLEQFRTLHDTKVTDVDPDYVIENYSYKFSNPETDQIKLATIVSGVIKVLGKETETELRRQPVNPSNIEQLLASKAIQDPKIDIVVIEAKSGSGKTVTAISNAIKLVKTQADKYANIIYIRNSVDDIGAKDEAIGFLSGNSEKEAVYLHPLNDTLDFIVRANIAQKNTRKAEFEDKVADGVEKLIKECNIEGRIAIGLRGRTFHNSVIIIDEAQNIGVNTMKKIITRIGKNSKVIIIGSQRQIDSAYLTKHNNGLSVLLNACRERKGSNEIGLFAINLHKVLRSPLSEFAEDLFSN